MEVTEGKVLLRYTSGGVSRKLVCPAVAGGTLLSRILVREGTLAQPGQDVCSVEHCPHDDSPAEASAALADWLRGLPAA